MITVKFANDTAIEAKSVMEHYTDRYVGGKAYSLTIEVETGEHDLPYYQDIVETEGATDTITTIKDDETSCVLTGYGKVDRLERIIDANGDTIRITLCKA